jgi:hypothetical protein
MFQDVMFYNTSQTSDVKMLATYGKSDSAKTQFQMQLKHLKYSIYLPISDTTAHKYVIQYKSIKLMNILCYKYYKMTFF